MKQIRSVALSLILVLSLSLFSTSVFATGSFCGGTCDFGHSTCGGTIQSYSVPQNHECVFSGSITNTGSIHSGSTLSIHGNNCFHETTYDDCHTHSFSITCGAGDVFFVGTDSSSLSVEQHCTLLPPETECGDWIVDLGEECDFGPLNGQQCIPEYGGSCTHCTINCDVATLFGSFCGDGSLNLLEECDDGNNQNGDGCSSLCQFENRPPVLQPIGNKYVDEDDTLTFMVTASDPDGDSVAIIASNLPDDSIFDGSQFSWTTDFDDSGFYDVTFIASDGELTDSETITITVGNKNRAPILDAIQDFIIEIGETIIFLVTGQDPDKDDLSYSATGLPSGSSFEDQIFSYTPAQDGVGEHDITFTTSDGDLEDTESLHISVKDNRERLVLRSVSFPNGEQVVAGTQLLALVNLKNDGSKELDDVHIRGYIMDFGIIIESGLFDIKANHHESRLLWFDIPQNMEPGWYYIGFTATNSNHREVRYRPIQVI